MFFFAKEFEIDFLFLCIFHCKSMNHWTMKVFRTKEKYRLMQKHLRWATMNNIRIQENYNDLFDFVLQCFLFISYKKCVRSYDLHGLPLRFQFVNGLSSLYNIVQMIRIQLKYIHQFFFLSIRYTMAECLLVRTSVHCPKPFRRWKLSIFWPVFLTIDYFTIKSKSQNNF